MVKGKVKAIFDAKHRFLGSIGRGKNADVPTVDETPKAPVVEVISEVSSKPDDYSPAYERVKAQVAEINRKKELDAQIPLLSEKEKAFIDAFEKVSNTFATLVLLKDTEMSERIELLENTYYPLYALQEHVIKKELSETPTTLRPLDRVRSDFEFATSRIGDGHSQPIFIVNPDDLEYMKLLAIEYASSKQGRIELFSYTKNLANIGAYNPRYAMDNRFYEAIPLFQDALKEGEKRVGGVEIPESQEMTLMDSFTAEHDYMEHLLRAVGASDGEEDPDGGSLDQSELVVTNMEFEAARLRLESLIKKTRQK